MHIVATTLLEPCSHTCCLQLRELHSNPCDLAFAPRCPCCRWPYHLDIMASCIAVILLPEQCIYEARAPLPCACTYSRSLRRQCGCRTLKVGMTVMRIGSQADLCLAAPLAETSLPPSETCLCSCHYDSPVHVCGGSLKRIVHVSVHVLMLCCHCHLRCCSFLPVQSAWGSAA